MLATCRPVFRQLFQAGYLILATLVLVACVNVQPKNPTPIDCSALTQLNLINRAQTVSTSPDGVLAWIESTYGVGSEKIITRHQSNIQEDSASDTYSWDTGNGSYDLITVDGSPAQIVLYRQGGSLILADVIKCLGQPAGYVPLFSDFHGQNSLTVRVTLLYPRTGALVDFTIGPLEPSLGVERGQSLPLRFDPSSTSVNMIAGMAQAQTSSELLEGWLLRNYGRIEYPEIYERNRERYLSHLRPWPGDINNLEYEESP